MAKIKPDPVVIRSGAVTVGDMERFLAYRAISVTGDTAPYDLTNFQRATGLPLREAEAIIDDDEQETPT